MFQAPAIIHVGSPTKDRGMRIRFETNEISDEQKLALIKYDGEFGHVLFKPNVFGEKDIPQEDAKESDEKSPSSRLYNTLFVLWKKMSEKGIEEDFNTFRRRQMEKFIGRTKQEIKKYEDK